MNNFSSLLASSLIALNQGLSVANLGSFIAEQSGQEAYAKCKNWKVEETREKISKIMTFFDLVSCTCIASSLLSRVSKKDSAASGEIAFALGLALFLGASAASLYATKYSLNFHSSIHSDVYDAVKANQPKDAGKKGRLFLSASEAGLSGSDYAQQSLHTMRSIVDFTAGCLIANLSPFQRRAYFLSAMINALSVSVIFQRVSLLFRFSEIRKKPDCVLKNDEMLSNSDCRAHTMNLRPIAEYRIFRSLFERMGFCKESEETCVVCLDHLK